MADLPHTVRPGEIFVFGSNLAGRHGKGAALFALRLGAVYGKGTGREGMTYAIPTKDDRLKPLPLSEIKKHADIFIAYAQHHWDEDFFLTRVGCGYAGYGDLQIAPLFRDVPANVRLDPTWSAILQENNDRG